MYRNQLAIMKNLSMLSISVIIMLTACYPGGVEYYEETDIVHTNFEEDFDFTAQRTYAMPDSVVKITGNLIQGEDPEMIEEPYNTEILQLIETNMQNYGWQKVADPATADVVLLPAAWTNTTIYFWSNYWCWYYPWYCGWGWGWYYPSFSSFTTGTLLMTITVNGDEYVEPTEVWSGAINGLLSGRQDGQRITRGINQAFTQSPYLKIN